jgi:hypothetical protein
MRCSDGSWPSCLLLPAEPTAQQSRRPSAVAELGGVRRRSRIPMTDETLIAVREFLDAFEKVFGTDWQYTKSMLGIRDETPEQAEAARQMGWETIHIIAPEGTFLEPRVDDEIENWGHRGMLLERYRRLKSLIGHFDTPSAQ